MAGSTRPNSSPASHRWIRPRDSPRTNPFQQTNGCHENENPRRLRAPDRRDGKCRRPEPPRERTPAETGDASGAAGIRILRQRPRRLSEEEIEAASGMPAKMDRNGDGRITCDRRARMSRKARRLRKRAGRTLSEMHPADAITTTRPAAEPVRFFCQMPVIGRNPGRDPSPGGPAWWAARGEPHAASRATGAAFRMPRVWCGPHNTRGLRALRHAAGRFR